MFIKATRILGYHKWLLNSNYISKILYDASVDKYKVWLLGEEDSYIISAEDAKAIIQNA